MLRGLHIVILRLAIEEQMAPTFTAPQHTLIPDMILSTLLKKDDMAAVDVYPNINR